jgi:hypothetical protein
MIGKWFHWTKPTTSAPRPRLACSVGLFAHWRGCQAGNTRSPRPSPMALAPMSCVASHRATPRPPRTRVPQALPRGPTCRRPTDRRCLPSRSRRGAAIQAAVTQVSKVIKLNAANDPNDLLGRPNGFTAAWRLYDSRASCDSPLDTTCGAAVEVWPTRADATARSDHIQAILKNAPALASEYDTVVRAHPAPGDGQADPSSSRRVREGSRHAGAVGGDSEREGE